jgi:hypothetical protein
MRASQFRGQEFVLEHGAFFPARAFQYPHALGAEFAEHGSQCADDSRMHPVSLAGGVAFEAPATGQVQLHGDGLTLYQLSDSADLIEHLLELGGEVLVVAADLGNRYGRRRR